MQYAVVITVVIAKPAQHTTDRKSSFGTYIPRAVRGGGVPRSLSGLGSGTGRYLCGTVSLSIYAESPVPQ